MKKCSIYVRNSTLDPSSYYRIVQYVPNLNCNCDVHDILKNKEFERNINTKSKLLKKTYQLILLIKIFFRSMRFLKQDIKSNIDFVIIQRTIVPRVSFSIIDKLFCKLSEKTKVLWDFDDNIIQSGEISKKAACLFMQRASAIIVTHDYLKSFIVSDLKNKVFTLPTTDSTIQYRNVNQTEYLKNDFEKEIKLLWLGTSANLSFLKEKIKVLDEAAKTIQNNGKRLVLTVVCNIPLVAATEYLQIVNIKWTRDVANEELLNNHIGIMPLPDTFYTRGKGSFKLIQYMAAGLPVIASPVGFNNETISDNGLLADSDDDWINAIVQLSSDFETWKEYSDASRSEFVEKFNPEKTVNLYNSLFATNTSHV